MERIIAGKTKAKQPVVWKFNAIDLIIATSFIIVCGAIIYTFMKLNLHWSIALVAPGIILVLGLSSIIRVGEDRIYTYYAALFSYLFRKRTFPKSTLKETCGIEFKEDYIKGSEYSRIIEVQGINLDLIPEKELDRRIFIYGTALNSIKHGKMMRMDKRMSFESFLDTTEKRIRYYTQKMNSEKDSAVKDKLKKKLNALNVDYEVFKKKESEEPIFVDAYYIIVYGASMTELDNNTDEVCETFGKLGMSPNVLYEDELKTFYEDFFLQKFNEKGEMNFPEIVEHKKTISFGDKEYKILSISNFPFSEYNAFMAAVFNIPDTNIIINFHKDDNLDKVNKRLNRTISSIGADLLTSKSESEKLKLQRRRDSFYEMLNELNDGSNTSNLFNVEIFIMFLNNKKHLKVINNVIKKSLRARVDYLNFKQFNAFSALLPHYSGKKFLDVQRDMTTSTLAGTFPFYSDKFIERNGDIIGVTGSGAPVCFDMWYNLNNSDAQNRTNSNMVIIGKSGVGKSYFMKLMLLNEIKKNTKIFILDPENEYEYIAQVFGGQTIDVSGGEIKINPFEIFPDLDESGRPLSMAGNMVGKHLPFISDFFKITLPYLPPYARTVLDRLVVETYRRKGIRNSTDVTKFKAKDFPTFDDLIQVAKEAKKAKDLQNIELEALIEIYDNLLKFNHENMYGSLWNGNTTLELNNDFTTFNFRALDSSSSSEIRNAQMLLITKFLNREVVKNYELQFTDKSSVVRKILLIVDEAHVFIDPNFPVALDLMKNMTKRIRKYNGSFWVTTQNIADFVGFDINTKTKATAVLNNCQYTTLFGLKPNDMEQVREMYAKSEIGAFTDEEVAYLLNASQGDCLLLIDQAHRISFHTSLKDVEKETPFILRQKETKEVKHYENA